MTKLLSQNAKMKKSGEAHGVSLFNFGIPAYQSRTGFKTCPMAGECAKGCYAQAGAYVWPAVTEAYEYRLRVTLGPNFEKLMMRELTTKLTTAKRKDQKLVVRIHDSGDFYSLTYLERWVNVMKTFPEVHFYAYTKQIPLFLKYPRLPTNFRVIFSEGGLADHKIPSTHFHSRVFQDPETLASEGYADASSDDLVAAMGKNHRIGLVYHGAKSKQWSTGGKKRA